MTWEAMKEEMREQIAADRKSLASIEVNSINVRMEQKPQRAFPLEPTCKRGKIRLREPRYFVVPPKEPTLVIESGYPRRLASEPIFRELNDL